MNEKQTFTQTDMKINKHNHLHDIRARHCFNQNVNTIKFNKNSVISDSKIERKRVHLENPLIS